MISNLEGTYTILQGRHIRVERNSWLITTIDDDYNSIVDPGEQTQKQALDPSRICGREIICPQTAKGWTRTGMVSNKMFKQVEYESACR